jgi:fido (protein-threonine AMPylation protein)
MTENIFRLWKPVSFEKFWQDCDTSVLDDIRASWFERRKKLTEDTGEYSDFLNKLKREHAIETGIVERLYDLKKGITETFINEGFVKSFLNHGDTDIPEEDLMRHLNDHLDSVNLVFDVVKEDRPLSVSFIRQLHQLVTRNQKSAEGRDQFGTKMQIELLKGQFKVRENNPTREDGTRILYCPPEQVDSEMDNLIALYNESTNIHPLIVATWFHHAFTTIHPFQDGNGRIARLLTSLIFIKNGFFPFTVLREEAKVKYIEALEKADDGMPQSLVSYFAEVQNRNIQKALNIKEVTSTSLVEVRDIFVQKIENWKTQNVIEHNILLASSRNAVFDFCSLVLNNQMRTLQEKLNGNAEISIISCSFNKPDQQHYFYGQIITYAKKHNYLFNRAFPKAWLMFKIEIKGKIKYQLGISIHHYGYDDSTLAIGSFLDSKNGRGEKNIDTTLPLEIPPHVISIFDSIETKKKNIKAYLENALTLALAQIASEI